MNRRPLCVLFMAFQLGLLSDKMINSLSTLVSSMLQNNAVGHLFVLHLQVYVRNIDDWKFWRPPSWIFHFFHFRFLQLQSWVMRRAPWDSWTLKLGIAIGISLLSVVQSWVALISSLEAANFIFFHFRFWWCIIATTPLDSWTQLT